MSAIKPRQPIDAPADIMAAARRALAERYRSKGQADEGDAMERGDRDDCWAMRHEVNRLLAERPTRVEHQPV